MSGNLARIGPGVNIRSGFGTASPVVTQTTALVYAEITSVNREPDADGYLWLKERLANGTEGWTRVDLFQGLVGDFSLHGGGVYGDWTSALKVFPGSQPKATPTTIGSTAPAPSSTTVIGLCACPVRPSTDTNDYGNVYAKVSHEGVDLAGPLGSAIKAGIKGVVVRAMASQYGGDSFAQRDIPLNDPTALNDWRWGYGLGNHVVLRVAWADLPGSTQSALVAANMKRKYVYIAFGHMQSLNVSQGQVVDANTIIGYRGGSGNVSGDKVHVGYHLHLETRISDVLDPTNPFDDAVTMKFSPHWLYDVPKQGQVYS